MQVWAWLSWPSPGNTGWPYGRRPGDACIRARGAHAIRADDRFDARDGQLQFHRLGRGRNEEAALRGLRLHRVHRHADVHDGRGGGCASRSSCSSFKNALASSEGTGSRSVRSWVERFSRSQSQAQFVGGEGAGGQAGGQSVDQAGQQERQRLEQFHGIIQLDFVFEAERIVEREQLALRFSARQFAQAQAFGAEPLGDAQRRQGGEILKAADAPAVEGFLQFGRRGEQREGQDRPGIWLRRRRGSMLTPENPRAAQMAASGFDAMAMLALTWIRRRGGRAPRQYPAAIRRAGQGRMRRK